jgi:hypothetical protein
MLFLEFEYKTEVSLGLDIRYVLHIECLGLISAAVTAAKAR